MSAGDFEGHEELIAELRAGALEAPDHLHRRVLAGGTTKRRRWADMSARRRMLVLVPIAATLAVGAAVIHGVVNSGAPAAHVAANGSQGAGGGSPGPVGPPGPTGSPGPTGPAAPTLAAGLPSATGAAYRPERVNPKVSTHEAFHSDALKSVYGTDQSVTIPTHRLVHAVASLTVAVANHGALTRATNRATQIVTQLGGFAQNVQYEALRAGSGNAYLDLRVPVGEAETAIGRLGGLGQLLSQSVTTKDLQQKAAQQASQADQLRRAIAIYEQALQSGSLSGSQRVDVQIKLANAEHLLKETRKAHARTLASGRTARIQLRLTTSGHLGGAVASNKRGRLGRLLHNAAGFLGLEAIIVLYVLIVAIPIVVLLALLWWLTSGRRRRDERRLLASA